MRTVGRYSDGEVGGYQNVTLVLAGRELVVRSEANADIRSVTVSDTDVVPPVGPGPWTVEFADDAQAVFSDDAFGHDLLAIDGRSDRLGMLERGWAILEYGVPVAARQVAMAIPADRERSLQRESVEVVDGWLFEPSELPEDRQQEIRSFFADITTMHEDYESFELVFRSAPGIGPNAFAMPGGTVLMTDELVAYAKDHGELVAVLAHEVGHLAHRHSLRILLQDSVTALFIAGATGDLTNVTALSASIPTVPGREFAAPIAVVFIRSRGRPEATGRFRLGQRGLPETHCAADRRKGSGLCISLPPRYRHSRASHDSIRGISAGPAANRKTSEPHWACWRTRSNIRAR